MMIAISISIVSGQGAAVLPSLALPDPPFNADLDGGNAFTSLFASEVDNGDAFDSVFVNDHNGGSAFSA